ncbi:SDR family NAD(P)-dependent oxidoreductase [Streptomyces violaceus]|uniref:SDR family NAD(P)-dependent oxidoreductase n=1 Tax=Streptomyces violaceus TaxID=1936 RepID=UPI002E209870
MRVAAPGLSPQERYGVLLTGEARGIGAGTARRFAREGARVLVGDQDPAQAARALRDEGLIAGAATRTWKRCAGSTPWAGSANRGPRGGLTAVNTGFHDALRP